MSTLLTLRRVSHYSLRDAATRHAHIHSLRRYHNHEMTCSCKMWANRLNTTSNPDRTSLNITKQPLTNDQLCAQNAGVLAVLNGTTHLDLILYNHAAFADPIVECSLNVNVDGANSALQLGSATVRRIDEDHSNPLAAWIDMGTPDYTSAQQNEALLNASTLVVEQLSKVATSVSAASFVMTLPPHSVAAVRVPL